MRARAIALVLLFATAPVAQAPTDLAPVMQRCSEAVDAIDRALAARDRKALAAPVAALATACKELPNSPAGIAAAASITAAATDLLRPIGDGAASDAHDLARLRAACTHCHLHTRRDNDSRGLFPNRGGAAFGTVTLRERDGAARTDAGGVVVFVEGSGVAANPPPRNPVIAQRGRRFEPAVLVVPPGTTVEFPNDDVVFHNVFSLSRGNAFDLGTYGKGAAKQRTFATPGLCKVHCNIHADMAASVLVLPTPWHAVTAADGTWSLPDLPAGTFTLRVWHPLADEQKHRLEVVADRATAVDLQVQESKPRAPHTDKNGRAYPEKY
ncbi:MAG: hypothetical protein JNK15_20080 [Planctomycetes bacterium]|nr:hypothetical protein [Planctomycetota bacterium]